jgi:hypothetical protein
MMATAPDNTQNLAGPSTDVDSLSGAGFSLADLADIDVTDIEEVRFVDLPAGVYDWEIAEGNLLDDEKEGVRRFKIEFELKVLEAVAVLEAGIDKDTLVNKIHTERFFIDPSKDEADVKKAIGRVRAFVTDTGGDSKRQARRHRSRVQGPHLPLCGRQAEGQGRPDSVVRAAQAHPAQVNRWSGGSVPPSFGGLWRV